ncbi:MAG: NAD(P)H-hydrate epimerase [Balneolia bacterium]|nr:NAD(P)H-hydrate epimerase [Balneolia bacterium]
MSQPHHSYLFSARESREIDRETIESFGITGFTLMEIAAKGSADFIRRNHSASSRVLALCGKGNNGGDALAVSRRLAEEGFHTDIYFPLGFDKLSPDTSANLKLLQKLMEFGTAGAINFLDEMPDPDSYDVIIDGIFGTGLERDVEGEPARIIEKVNAASGPIVYAMDIPSGIHSDTGKVMGIAVKANFTCFFGTRKVGGYFGDSFDYCGTRVFTELPFPAYLMKPNRPVQLLDPETYPGESIKEPAKPAAHKYENGNVYVVGGSPGLTGAVVMTAQAAWSAGVGSVTVFAPEKLSAAYDEHFVEIMRKIVPSDDTGNFSPDAAQLILDEVNKRPGVVIIGPGIGRIHSAKKLVEKLLSELDGVVVLDADGFTFLGDEKVMKAINPNLRLIFTPHPGEQKTVFGAVSVSPNEALEMLKKLPCSANSVGVFKGLPVQVVSEAKCHVTAYDTRVFSRTGYGDVLAGLIAGRCAKLVNENKMGAETLHDQVCDALIYSYKKILKHENPSPVALIR